MKNVLEFDVSEVSMLSMTWMMEILLFGLLLKNRVFELCGGVFCEWQVVEKLYCTPSLLPYPPCLHRWSLRLIEKLLTLCMIVLHICDFVVKVLSLSQYFMLFDWCLSRVQREPIRDFVMLGFAEHVNIITWI